MILTTRCAGCERPGAVLCRTCRFALAGGARSAEVDGPPGVLVALPFSGRTRAVLLGFKYRNRRAVARHLAGLLVNRLVAGGRADALDVVTWAPTGPRRRHERGFDQAELIARHVARQLGVPCRRLLDRRGADGPQTGLDRAGRLAGPAFRAHPRSAGRVLVVDDVVTTGATLAAASGALLAAGASQVTCLAVAATPSPATARQRVA